eukprot:gene3417-8290_t
MNGAKPKQLPVLGTQDQLMTDMMAGHQTDENTQWKQVNMMPIIREFLTLTRIPGVVNCSEVQI